MKNFNQVLLVILFSLIFFKIGTSQTWFQEGDTWVFRCGAGISGSDGYCEMKVAGDTIINNTNLKILKIKFEGYSQLDQTNYAGEYMQYAYELDGKVFFAYSNDLIGEAINVNLEVDTIYEYDQISYFGCYDNAYLHLDSIGEFQLENQDLKIQYFSFYDPLWDYTFYPVVYERIGVLEGNMLVPHIPCLFDGEDFRLCQFTTATDSIRFLDQDCYYFTTSTINESFTNVEISPNPTSSMLLINHEKTPEAVSIFDLGGRLLISKQDVNEIDLAFISKGVYLIKIEIDDQIIVKKFIKL